MRACRASVSILAIRACLGRSKPNKEELLTSQVPTSVSDEAAYRLSGRDWAWPMMLFMSAVLWARRSKKSRQFVASASASK